LVLLDVIFVSSGNGPGISGGTQKHPFIKVETLVFFIRTGNIVLDLFDYLFFLEQGRSSRNVFHGFDDFIGIKEEVFVGVLGLELVDKLFSENSPLLDIDVTVVVKVNHVEELSDFPRGKFRGTETANEVAFVEKPVLVRVTEIDRKGGLICFRAEICSYWLFFFIFFRIFSFTLGQTL